MIQGFKVVLQRERWLTGQGAGGSYKHSPDAFSVREIPVWEPEGEGEHQWLKIEKIGLSTTELADQLAREARVDRVCVGFAGLKDRDARTIQCFTIQGGKPVEKLAGVRILERSWCRRKLRVGELAGNRFDIKVEGCDSELLMERARRLERVPNFYGIQRFAGGGAERGFKVLRGEDFKKMSELELKFALSAAQSALFNEVLLRRGDRFLAGDLVEEGIPTGPIFGHSMRWPVDEALELEEEVLDRARLPEGVWEQYPKLTKGTRRACWVEVKVRVEPVEGGVWLRFGLPSGSYATVVLEELL
jgi:tRNA pseudouridine13 synthase